MKTKSSKHGSVILFFSLLAGCLVILPVPVSFSHTVSFQVAPTFAVGDGPSSLAVGDFNGDGKLDLAVANSGGSFSCGDVSILLGDGTGSFGAAGSFPAGGSVAIAEDIEKYYQGPGTGARERIKLFRLVWDVAGEAFGQRQV